MHAEVEFIGKWEHYNDNVRVAHMSIV